MYRLIYKSRSIKQIDWEMVSSIIETSQVRNEKREISGVLLATKHHYLQVLEGSFTEVNKLFNIIIKDPRHDQVELVSFTCAENRIFSHWSMHGIGLFNFNIEVSEQLKAQFGEEEGEVRFPIEEWSALAMISQIQQINN